MYLLCDVIEIAFQLSDLSSRNLKPRSDHENKVRLIPIEGHSTKHQTNLFTTVKVIKNKRSLTNCYSQKGPKETGQGSVMWYPETEKGHQINTEEI